MEVVKVLGSVKVKDKAKESLVGMVLQVVKVMETVVEEEVAAVIRLLVVVRVPLTQQGKGAVAVEELVAVAVAVAVVQVLKGVVVVAATLQALLAVVGVLGEGRALDLDQAVLKILAVAVVAVEEAQKERAPAVEGPTRMDRAKALVPAKELARVMEAAPVVDLLEVVVEAVGVARDSEDPLRSPA